MGIVETLIASQRRPDAEALRIATAVKESMPTAPAGRDSDAAAAAWAAAASEAVEVANYAIAEEKTPRRAPAAPAHLEQFMDIDTAAAVGFDSDSDTPVQSASHCCDPRFVMSDDEPTPQAPVATAESEPAEVAVPATPTGSPPWRTDSADRIIREDGVNGTRDGIPAPPWALDTSAVDESITDTEPEAAPFSTGAPVYYAYDEPADPAAVNGYGLPESGYFGGDDSGEGSCDMPHTESGAGYGGMPAPGSAADGPRTTARWERRQPAPSPWGDEPEVAIPDASDPHDTDEPSVVIPPCDPHVSDNGEPEPSQYATAPPEDFDEPQPQPREPVLAKLRRALSLQGVVPWFTGPRRALKIAGYGIGGVLLVAVIVASFLTAGSRSRPPEPAGQIPAAPAANDTAPPAAAEEQVLKPATVSASCGNETDAVAPFSGDKTRAWKCKRINGLDLNVINISFSCPVVITSITVVPGFAYVAPDGRDEWVRNRLTTGISWRMGGAIYPQQIVPTRTGVTMKVPNVITQQMSATITSSMRPKVGESSTDDFGSKADESAKVDEFSAISKIVIHGHPVDPGSGLCGAGG